ncbi:MAG: VWA domain-containing protein [Rhodobacteraceae bacterium]|nr:VWA domain-containing protein [Paracoccaceae bacterium]
MFKHTRSKAIARFTHSESGAMIILGLIFFVLMLFVASLAIDVARYEQERVRLQSVADRAVLAAANVRPESEGQLDLSPEEYLRGYFLAEGYSIEQLDQWSIIVGDGISGRGVEMRPTAQLSTILMPFIGVDRLTLGAHSRAEVGAPMKIEIVLVVDISGSMGWTSSNGRTRIENLRDAARDLVTELLEDRDEGEVFITIVPYDGNVAVPPGMLGYFENLDGWAGRRCADFDDFPQLYNFLGNGNPSYAENRNPNQPNAVRNSLQSRIRAVNCGTPQQYRVLQPMITDLDTALTHIDSLQATGTTSIDLGLRFGAMFFDSDLQPVITDRIAAGHTSGAAAGRPAGVDDPETLQFMILMTDGANCCGARGSRQTLDLNSRAVCDNLKAEGVMIYGVAFEAPQHGVDLMQQCASSPSHFSNTHGQGLADAFGAIGRHINATALRLTQ